MQTLLQTHRSATMADLK